MTPKVLEEFIRVWALLRQDPARTIGMAVRRGGQTAAFISKPGSFDGDYECAAIKEETMKNLGPFLGGWPEGRRWKLSDTAPRSAHEALHTIGL